MNDCPHCEALARSHENMDRATADTLDVLLALVRVQRETTELLEQALGRLRGILRREETAAPAPATHGPH